MLVTGASGFIGRHLTAACLKAGWEVLAGVHRTSLPRELVEQGARSLALNLQDLDGFAAALPGVDTVFHVAAFVPPRHDDPRFAQRCLADNGLATLRLAQHASEIPGLRLIYFSSAQGYRFSPVAVSEDWPVYPAARAAYYLASKLLGELYVEHVRRETGLDAITLRIGCCYGPGMSPRSVMALFISRARAGARLEVFDGGIPTGDHVYVADVVQVAMAAARGGDPGVYNVGSGKAHSLLEAARCVAAAFPEREVQIEVHRPGRAVPASFPALSVEKAAKTWGFSPLNLPDGIIAYRQQIEEQPGDRGNIQ